MRENTLSIIYTDIDTRESARTDANANRTEGRSASALERATDTFGRSCLVPQRHGAQKVAHFIRCLRSSPDMSSRFIFARLCVPSFAFNSFSARFSLPTFSSSIVRFSYGENPTTCMERARAKGQRQHRTQRLSEAAADAAPRQVSSVLRAAVAHRAVARTSRITSLTNATRLFSFCGRQGGQGARVSGRVCRGAEVCLCVLGAGSGEQSAEACKATEHAMRRGRGVCHGNVECRVLATHPLPVRRPRLELELRHNLAMVHPNSIARLRLPDRMAGGARKTSGCAHCHHAGSRRCIASELQQAWTGAEGRQATGRDKRTKGLTERILFLCCKRRATVVTTCRIPNSYTRGVQPHARRRTPLAAVD